MSGPSQVDDTDLCDLGNISDGVRSAALPQVRSQLACPIVERPHTSIHLPYPAVETTLGETPARHFQLEFLISFLLSLDASRDTPIRFPPASLELQVPTAARRLVLRRAVLRRPPPVDYFHLPARLRWHSAPSGLRPNTTTPMYPRPLAIRVRKTSSLWWRL